MLINFFFPKGAKDVARPSPAGHANKRVFQDHSTFSETVLLCSGWWASCATQTRLAIWSGYFVAGWGAIVGSDGLEDVRNGS